MKATQALPITTAGPWRAIGMRYEGSNANNEIPALWGQIAKRRDEIEAPAVRPWFGVCRCLPGATDGSYEYIAASAATASSPVPAGMVEVEIPQCEYAVIPVPGLDEVKQAWESLPALLAGLDGWKPYCDADGCDCATHACFEYYPPEFQVTDAFSIYVPLKKK